MNKNQPGRQTKNHHVFSRGQNLATDFRSFAKKYDPSSLADEELRALFGSISLQLDYGGKVNKVFAVRVFRRFVQCLHHGWPRLGYFLSRDKPIGSPALLGRFPFLGLALCISDLRTWANDQTGMLRIEADQRKLRVFQQELVFGLRHLGRRAGISLRFIAVRELEIRSQIGQVLTALPPAEGK